MKLSSYSTKDLINEITRRGACPYYQVGDYVLREGRPAEIIGINLIKERHAYMIRFKDWLNPQIETQLRDRDFIKCSPDVVEKYLKKG